MSDERRADRTKYIRFPMIITVSLMAVMLLGGTAVMLQTASAIHVTPTVEEGILRCFDLIDDPDAKEVLITKPPEGQTTADGITIDVYSRSVDDERGFIEVFDWQTSTVLVLGVIVRDTGTHAHFYDYRPAGERSDISLHAPLLSNGFWGSPSIISFCYIPLPEQHEEAVDDLISDVENLEDVPQSTKTSLTAPLKQASEILNDDNPNNDQAACGKLGAFINQVNANERRGTLTEDQADDLRTQAQEIMESLDC